MSSLASRRHRITLMAEVKNQGAGGRMTYTSPVIADVWASVEEDNSSFVQRASHENLPARARFVTQFRKAYQNARRLSWRGMTYRITGSKVSRSIAAPTLTLEAVLSEGGEA